MLPVFWDYIPIGCVLITHLSNFKKEILKQDEQNKLTFVSGSDYSDNRNTGAFG